MDTTLDVVDAKLLLNLQACQDAIIEVQADFARCENYWGKLFLQVGLETLAERCETIKEFLKGEVI